MLSDSTTTTPRRPLPPAKARKSTSLHFKGLAPPPPYEPPLEQLLLNSPITVTAQLVDAASKNPDGIGIPTSPGLDNWMNEKSREELSGLLLKADGIIRSRETELSLTSAFCKSLYSDNFTLKSKHEALLARLPGTNPASTVSPLSPQLHLDVPSFDQSPSYSTMALSPSPSQQSTLGVRPRRIRRVSVTPAELAMLSDQNAELIDKLEKLEAESLKADQAGTRKLRKLEQEIQTLREELEKTQARGVELEEQAKAAANTVTVQKRKEEREALLQTMREKSMSASTSVNSLEEIKDFAPPSGLPSRSTPIKRGTITTSAFSTSSHSTSRYSIAQVFDSTGFEEEDQPHDPESYFPTPPGSNCDLPPPPEYAIVSQLLSKIRELEETNAQIKEQQKDTEEQMRAAHWDAESIRRVYDYLDDGEVDLEIQDEDDAPLNDLGVSHLPSSNAFRLSSLRKSIVGDMNRLMDSESDLFADGISKGMHSTVRDGVGNRGTGPKTRKTVIDLFDSEPDTSTESALPGEYPLLLKVSPAFRSFDTDLSIWSSAATEGLGPPSPTLSATQTPMESGMGRSLGSELGSEVGDNWAQRGFNHHLRASSLYDLAGLNSSPASPSESVAPLPPITLTPIPGPSGEQDIPTPSTPPRMPDLQFMLEPPTPTPDKLRSPASKRQHQLSQVVRARTSRWVEGRFPQSPRPQGAVVLRKRPSAAKLAKRTSIFGSINAEVLDETFGVAAGRVRRVASGSYSPMTFGPSDDGDSAATPRAEDDRHAKDSREGEPDRSVSLRRDASVVDPADGNHEGFVGFVLEAWLWLQFIVVVGLFLWAMARRGPKVVLEAERRNAHRATLKQ